MLEVLWNTIQIFATGIIAIGGAGAIFVGLYRWAKKPDYNRDEKLKGHDEKLDNDNKRIIELEKRQKQTDKDLKMIMSSLSAIMNHMITGDHIEELKEKHQSMQEYLIDRR